jgi:asparagine synthase (glutamine-hydrolysing)
LSQDNRWLSVRTHNYWFSFFSTSVQSASDSIVKQHRDLKKRLIIGDQRSGLYLFYNEKEPETAVKAELGVVFEGELYNKKEIEEEYKIEADQNCAQIIAQLYSKIGSRAIEKIKGIYCLIIWDKTEKLLLCVRDRLGIYPLFYSIKAGDLYVSTSLESLTLYAGIDKEVDRMQIAEHLLDRWVEPERTYYKQIKRVLPGNVLEIRGSYLNRYRYWKRADKPLKSAEEAELAEFDNLLKQAVDRTIGGRRAGIFLSSGIDSVTVAAIAAQLTAKEEFRPIALSLYFPHPAKDESLIQSSVAKRLGFNHTLISLDESLGSKDPLDSFLNMSFNWPVPPIIFWSPAFYYLGLKGVEQGCQVILTGEGGDEWVGVGPYLAADLIKSIDLKGLYDFWIYLNRSHTLTKLGALNITLWKFSLRVVLGKALRNALFRISPRLFKQRARRLITESFPDWFAPDLELKNELIEKIYEFTERQLQSLSQSGSFYSYNGQIYFEHPVTSIGHEQSFEMGKRIGVKISAPFLDSDLIDLLYAAPPNFLIRNGYGKAPTRKILAKTFPELNFDKQKKFFLDPLADSLLLKKLPEIYKSEKTPSFLADLEIIDKKRFNAYKDKSDKNGNSLFFLREILNLETWLSGK